MIDENDLQMRGYIVLAEKLQRLAGASDPGPQAENDDAETVQPWSAHDIVDDLHDIVFKLEAHAEPEGEEFGAGIETGMQRAADMITNLIRRIVGDE